MSLENCSFTANDAGDEGLAVISIGLLDRMENVTFANNTLHCDTGEYGDMEMIEVGMKGPMPSRRNILQLPVMVGSLVYLWCVGHLFVTC